ncbi:MAG: ABC transporter ATP-binding protein [Tissierellia bacterium]|nr:ABC transporter ATP-binding protein [Tissierellia bacterium]
MENIIEIKKLNKSFTGFQLKDVDFNLKSGTIMGLIGENGAGKTTIIKSILGLINPDSGDISIFGQKLSNDLKEDIGVVLDDGFFSDYLDVSRLNKIMGSIYKNWDDEVYHYYLKRFNLPENKKIKDFSRGMKMKLGIALALSHHPKLLILDEPTSGLDPIVRDELLDIFLEFIQDENKAILVSSHITSDLEKVADYITFVKDGEILMSEEKDTLLYEYGICRCSLEDLAGIDREFVVKYKKGQYGVDVLVKDLSEFKVQYKNLVVDKPTLDEIMLLQIRGESR